MGSKGTFHAIIITYYKKVAYHSLVWDKFNSKFNSHLLSTNIFHCTHYWDTYYDPLPAPSLQELQVGTLQIYDQV